MAIFDFLSNKDTLLEKAVETGDVGKVQRLLHKGAGVEEKDPYGQTALLIAVQKSYVDIVKVLLENHADVKAKDAKGMTALHKAVRLGQYEITKLLLESDLDVDARNEDGETALTIATHEAHGEIVKLLLESNVNVNMNAKGGVTALMEAARAGNIEIARLLLQADAKVNAKDSKGVTALRWAVFNGDSETVDILLENKADVNVVESDGGTALITAASKGHADIVNKLLESDADVNIARNNGVTALWMAAQNGHLNIVTTLLEKGADVNVKHSSGLSAVRIAQKKGQSDIVSLLLDHGVEDEHILPVVDETIKGKTSAARSVCPIFNEESSFIGLWALNKSFSVSVGSLAELMSLAEPTLQALTKNPQRRVPNDSTEVGNGVRFDGGVFIMINDEKAPNEEIVNQDFEKAYILIDQYGIQCLIRCERSDPRINTPPPRAEQMSQKATGFAASSTAWFKDPAKRGGPHSSSDFDIFEIAQYSLQEWANNVSIDPHCVQCTVLPISDLGDVTRTLFDAIKRDHNITSEDAVNIFDEYLGAACPKCLGGLTGNLLQTISTYSNAAGVIGGGASIQHILRGRCANCESDTYYVIWHGDRNPH